LQETLEAKNLSQADLALRTGLSEKTISQIINGKEPVSHKTALLLEKVLGTPAHFWNNLESKYRERLAKREERERLAEEVAWVKSFPVIELIKRGAIQACATTTETLEALLGFFGVSSPETWNAVWKDNPRAAFRKSPTFEGDACAIATWLRLGEIEGNRLNCEPYDKDRFRVTLHRIRSFTVEPPETFVPKLIQQCAWAGVAVVFIREIKGAPVSGAARWLSPDKALIQQSLRHKTNDCFWFTFFHEAGHILKHGKKEWFIDDGQAQSPLEQEADRFAADTLIPPAEAPKLAQVRTRQQIIAFAQAIGIAPGIVLGRQQKDGRIPYANVNNNLKENFQWADLPNPECPFTKSAPAAR
jgi:addiction module HigA family antidote